MKLFFISQDQNNEYDTYDSAVVAAPDENTARNIDPVSGGINDWKEHLDVWCSGPEHVFVRYIGEAAADVEQGVICSSFNAG